MDTSSSSSSSQMSTNSLSLHHFETADTYANSEVDRRMHEDLRTILKTSSKAAASSTAAGNQPKESSQKKTQTTKNQNNHHHLEANHMKYLYVRSQLILKINHKHLLD